jgi:adenylosuccinate lyase
MPHKKNPILCENVCGLARVVRSAALAAFEDVALWHERDISHSSTERMIGPDATATAEFMASRLGGVVRGLVVNADRMARNLAMTGGLVHSEGLLLTLVGKGLKRQEAYVLVQRAALAAAEGKGTMEANLLADPDVRARLTGDEIRACFSVEHHLRWVDTLLARRTTLV